MNLISTKSGKLYISHSPSESDLQSKRFDLIWNLASELEYLVPKEQQYCNNVLFANIKDRDIPKDVIMFQSQLNEVLKQLNDNNRVLIHCMGGIGRTGLALGCILKALGISSNRAISLVKNACGGPETKEQINFILNFK
jgi:protein-tyrosine phosphatase